MRAIITLLFLILFSQSAGALSIGSLYKNCKPYADSGFNFPKNDVLEAVKATSCIYYFKGIIDVVTMSCEVNGVDLSIVDLRLDADSTNINAYIQKFINSVAEKPEMWDSMQSLSVLDAIAGVTEKCPN